MVTTERSFALSTIVEDGIKITALIVVDADAADVASIEATVRSARIRFSTITDGVDAKMNIHAAPMSVANYVLVALRSGRVDAVQVAVETTPGLSYLVQATEV